MVRNDINTIDILNRDKCTGCGACFNICPSDAISMEADSEGFLFPRVDYTKCIKCGRCANICPQLTDRHFSNDDKPVCYANIAKDRDILDNSSSGGAFSLIAESVIKDNGIVYGAAWTEDFKVHHIAAEKSVDELRLSKYIQSDTKLTFQEVKAHLNDNRKVLYTGCPCQIDGLKAYLGKDYANLILVDIICHGVPSYKALKAFLQDKVDFEDIKSISFRNKKIFGWSTTITINLKNNLFIQSYNESEWWSAFKNGLLFRKCCYHCPYAQIKRVGDITIGDFWGINQFIKDNKTNLGTSLVLANSKKGARVLEKINKNLQLHEEVPVDIAIKNNGNLAYPSAKHPHRDFFYRYLDRESFEDSLYKALNDRYDVGIVGYWYATNYGSILTYYALHEAIKSLGLSPVLIDRPEKEKDPEGEDVISRNFLRNRVNISKSVRWHELNQLNNLCDSFVVGSDQVWTRDAIKNMGFFFFLAFISEDKRKIAYAPSFGSSKLTVHPDTLVKLRYYAHKFDKVSIREDIGVKICKNKLGICADRVLDPIFLQDEEAYRAIAAKSAAKTDFDYIATYILDPTEDKIRFLTNAAAKLNLPMQHILDGRKGTFEKNKALLNLPGIADDVSVEDWLAYFINAKYILTDSHHGVAFAIYFNKPFICYANIARGISRFTSLLSLFGLLDRLIFSSEDLDNVIYKSTDYKKINNILKKEKALSIGWLRSGLNLNKPKTPSGNDALNDTIKDIYNQLYKVKTENNMLKELLKNNEQKLQFETISKLIKKLAEELE